MLSLYVRKSIEVQGDDGKKRNYTVFADSENTKNFYAIPEAPEFAVDENTKKPKFSLIWYYGSNQEYRGGVCAFTVALPMPQGPNEIKQIGAALTNDTSVIARAHDIYDMVVAMTKGDNTTAKALQQLLGFDDKQAKQYKSLYKEDQTYVQFLPSSDINLQPVPVTGGTVTVRGFGGQDAFQQWQKGDESAASFTGSYQTTPSLLGNNQAVVSFDLTSLGVNLFWHAFGGPSLQDKSVDDYKPVASVVAVTYEINFEGMLPPAKVTVTLKAEEAAKLITQQVTSKDTWGHETTRTEVIGRSFTKDVKSMIDVEIPSTSYLAQHEADKKKQEEQYGIDLEQWGSNQLAEMVKDQLPDVSWDDLQNGKLEENVLHNETRTFQMSKAIAFNVNPQGQLPTISSLLPDNTSLEDYFQTVNLDEKPYYDVQVTIQPPANLDQYKVASVAVSPTFGGKTLYKTDGSGDSVNTIVFNSNNKEAVTLRGTFDVNDSQQKKEFDYSYTVNYTTATAPYQVKGMQENDYNLSLTNPPVLGVVYNDLKGTQILWDIFSRGTLKVKYGDINQEYILNKDNYDAKLALTIGKDVTPTIKYQLELAFASGGGTISYPLDSNKWASADISQSSAMIQVPFSNTKIYTITCPDVASGNAVQCIVQAEYKLTFSGNIVRTISKTIVLTSQNSGVDTWTVPTTDLESTTGPRGTLSYTAQLITQDGVDKIEGNDDNGSTETILILKT